MSAAGPGALPLADDGDPAIVALGERGIAPSNLYRVLAGQPALLEAWTDFAWRLRGACVTPRSLRELQILRAAQLGPAPYIWQDHVPMALAAGVDAELIAALHAWRDSARFDAAQRAVLALTDALILDGHVRDATLEELRGHFDDAARIELTLTAAFYAMVPRTLDGLRVPLSPVDGPPPEVPVPFRCATVR